MKRIENVSFQDLPLDVLDKRALNDGKNQTRCMSPRCWLCWWIIEALRGAGERCVGWCWDSRWPCSHPRTQRLWVMLAFLTMCWYGMLIWILTIRISLMVISLNSLLRANHLLACCIFPTAEASGQRDATWGDSEGLRHRFTGWDRIWTPEWQDVAELPRGDEEIPQQRARLGLRACHVCSNESLLN